MIQRFLKQTTEILQNQLVNKKKLLSFLLTSMVFRARIIVVCFTSKKFMNFKQISLKIVDDMKTIN